ncbi:cell division protein FtsB [Dyella ginsengisoli]|uniref:cell division protein FtsB n=1 Tax=Dyella ginsengisoli TaxID=363848 RepID=UPI00034D77AF|nr:cell division protein FtsB [Dyella ginsengisoli]
MLRWVALILIALLIALQFKLWSDAGGMREVDTLRAAVKKQTDENQRLQQRNQALAADVTDLKSGEQAVEARARAELGLIKPGETFYQVVEGPAAAGSAAAAPASSGTP